jgi:hypothetical protein
VLPAQVVDCADGKKREVVPFFETLVDPWSYTQTVENFFYLSCRVKSGNVGIFLGADNDVYVRPFNAQDIGDMYDGGQCLGVGCFFDLLTVIVSGGSL